MRDHKQGSYRKSWGVEFDLKGSGLTQLETTSKVRTESRGVSVTSEGSRLAQLKWLECYP